MVNRGFLMKPPVSCTIYVLFNGTQKLFDPAIHILRQLQPESAVEDIPEGAGLQFTFCQPSVLLDLQLGIPDGVSTCQCGQCTYHAAHKRRRRVGGGVMIGHYKNAFLRSLKPEGNGHYVGVTAL